MSRSLFRSFQHRNFRLFFVGQSLSLVGTWTQTMAMYWLLSELAESKWVYGVVGFTSQLPALLLPPFAGVIVDRLDRRRLIVVTQTVAMVQAFGLAWLVYAGSPTIWDVLLFNLMLSAVNAFDMPARQTFLGDLIENRDDLANAIALNSSMVNGARLLGPSLAAALIIAVGEAGCFAINGLSFLAVLFALVAMRIPRRVRPAHVTPLWQGFQDGWRYVRSERPIRATLFIVAAISLFGLPYNLLLPYFTREVLDASPWTYGWLSTAPGFGALVAGLIIAWRGMLGLTRRLKVAPFIAGVCLALASFCHTKGGVLLFLFGTGFGFLTFLNSANTLLQTYSDDDKRGRVLGFYAICFTGMAPFGNLAVPGIADALGTQNAMRVAAGLCLAAGTWFAFTMGGWRGIVRAKLRRPIITAPETELPTIAQ